MMASLCHLKRREEDVPEKHYCVKHPDREAVGAIHQVLMCRECFDEALKKEKEPAAWKFGGKISVY